MSQAGKYLTSSAVPTPLPTTPAKAATSTLLQPRIALRRLEAYCRRLSISLKAGIDILRILESEAKQATGRQQVVALDMIQRIRSGATLAEAFAAQALWFPKLLVEMVQAGETAGSLDQIFLHMADYYKDLRDAHSQFLKLIAWPLIQLALALLVISGTIWLQGMLARDSSGPAYDAIGLGLSGTRGFALFWTIVLMISAVKIVIAFGIWRNWFDCHRKLMPLLRNLPIVGTVITTTAMSRFSMTLSMLLNAGVDAIRSVQTAFRSTGNYYYIDRLPMAIDKITHGESLAESFRATGVFSREFVDAIETGELSGSETESLEHLTAEYLRRARTALTQLAVATSVFIWIAISGLLIFIIISMMLNYVNLLYSSMKI